MESLRRFEPLFFVVLRVVAGVMFALHGTQRLFGWPAGERATGMLRIAASSIELITGTLIAAGIVVPIAAIIAAVTMLAGVVTRRTELIALYAFLWLWIAARASARPASGRPQREERGNDAEGRQGSD